MAFDDTDYPFLAPLQDNWEQVRDECLAVEHHEFVHVELSRAPGWGSFPLIVLFKEHEENCPLAPRTLELAASIPRLTSVGFARLAKGTHYKPHEDGYPKPFRDQIRKRWGASISQNRRFHLTLDGPESDCYLVSSGERRDFRPGTSFVFENRKTHEANNQGDRDRFILLLDFIREEAL